MKQFDDMPVPQVVEESIVERSDDLPVCGDGTEEADVGVHGEQVKEAVGEVVVELVVPSDECLPMQLDVLGPEQAAPKDQVLEPAEMSPKDHVLEFGTEGWSLRRWHRRITCWSLRR